MSRSRAGLTVLLLLRLALALLMLLGTLAANLACCRRRHDGAPPPMLPCAQAGTAVVVCMYYMYLPLCDACLRRLSCPSPSPSRTAHCPVPMLINVQAMRRAHLLDGAVPS